MLHIEAIWRNYDIDLICRQCILQKIYGVDIGGGMADRSSYPSEQADKFLLRMPDGMRGRIAEAAKENGRSMNAEIIARLEQSLSMPIVSSALDEPLAEHIAQRVVDLTAQERQRMDKLFSKMFLQEMRKDRVLKKNSAVKKSGDGI